MKSVHHSRHSHKILIADDSEMNRSILTDMLEDEYDIIEAENGVQALAAIQAHISELSLVLLDIVMPEMDGFGVLEAMNRNGWIKELPVVIISAENAASHVEQAYQLGAADFIRRPFDALIVHHRVVNTILLYAKQKKLLELVAEQIHEKERQNTMMIEILSHIVEFHNGESGLHVRHVHTLTERLLERLSQKDDKYNFSPSDISVIATASALHDIGKIAIPSEVLNKPGRLTDEEFSIMQGHALMGAEILEKLPFYQDEPLLKRAYEICRWHHERYDGCGYPDGLKGDDIPISAQTVAVADVYDALTSDRVYKKAVPHEAAVQMILEGQCGTFNPLLMECLRELAPRLRTELERTAPAQEPHPELQRVAEEMLKREQPGASKRTLQLLEHERMKYNFFAALTEELQFEFTVSPPLLTLSTYGANKLGFPELIMDPLHDKRLTVLMAPQHIAALSDALRSTSPGQPVVTYDCQLNLNGEHRWFRIISRAVWSGDDDPPRYTGAIGKAMDIHDSHTHLAELQRRASTDALTGLLFHAAAKERIQNRLAERPDGKFALAIFDLDLFKEANDGFGHMFGDRVLTHVARLLRQNIRSGDIVARAGGDEFLIFLEYKKGLERIVKRIFASLSVTFEGFPISISMGVASTETVGFHYDDLFRAADNALYTVKRGTRGQFCFYDPSMQGVLTALSPIGADAADSDSGHPQEGGKEL